jgi:GNAT superfamily N-acetyltransferase
MAQHDGQDPLGITCDGDTAAPSPPGDADGLHPDELSRTMSEARARPFVTRPLSPDDVPAGLRLCRQAGWNQTEEDWRAFLMLSPETCRAAWVNGRIAGTVTVLPYGAFAWIGMVLVDESARGHGLGTALLEDALALVGPACTACLDATPLGRPVYSRLGFRADGELQRLARPASTGMATGAHPPDAAGPPALRSWRPDDLNIIAAWDRDVFGADRSALLSLCAQRAPHLAWVAETTGEPAGYILGRSGYDFDHIGPLVARTAEVATALMTAALTRAARPIVLDVPDRGSRFAGWLHAVGFRVQRRFTRMSRGPQRSPAWPDTLFAVLGPEFG